MLSSSLNHHAYHVFPRMVNAFEINKILYLSRIYISISRTPLTRNCKGYSTFRYLASTSQESRRLFPEELNIIYDSKCNVCKLEIDFLTRRDSSKINVGDPKLKVTDLEASDYDPNDPANAGVTYASGMKEIHAVTYDGKVVKGVPVFRMAYEKVNLGWLFQITTWPIIKQLADIFYRLFAKYRTLLTRGSSIENLVEQYEAKQALEHKMKEDNCNECAAKKS